MLRQISRLSRVWMPSGGIAAHEAENAHSKLIRAGYLRQSQSGIFHMLPLGLRVQEKIERLVARHMEESLAASRVSLSSLSPEALWEKSGRLQNVASELFRFSDRRDTAYLLAPTHEEEITSLVGKTTRSYKELPLRLYQITRKYRDEFRPRHGLLRGREFIMKDLYTFDSNLESAMETYEKVRSAYSRIFAEMKLPVLAAKASSGDMGGDLSHEYHLPSPIGDDHVIHCGSCDYVINEEIAKLGTARQVPAGVELGVWRGITTDRSTLVNVWYPKRTTSLDGEAPREYSNEDVSIPAVKSIVPGLDTTVRDSTPLWLDALAGGERKATQLINIFDSRLPASFADSLGSDKHGAPMYPEELGSPQPQIPISLHGAHGGCPPRSMLRVRTGDQCPRCPEGVLRVEKAIELGHTFHLGTRYSEPLDARISIPPSKESIPIQMGCHGIGISRIVGAVAEHLADEVGLNWPVAIAPYSCVVIPANDSDEDDALCVYEKVISSSKISSEVLDVVLDDRRASLPWKLTDADLIGFPVMVTLGREWRASGRVEVQCRRLGMKDVVSVDKLPQVVDDLHAAL